MDIFGNSSGISVGDYLIITTDFYRGFMGKNVFSLDALIGRVLKVILVDKERNIIKLEVPSSTPVDIPYKHWKDVALKFDKVKTSNWRDIFNITTLNA